jgi:hypothetical protein
MSGSSSPEAFSLVHNFLDALIFSGIMMVRVNKEISMREYKVTFIPINPAEAPVGPIIVTASSLDEACHKAVEKLKSEHPDRPYDAKDYKPFPQISWRELPE